MDAKRFIKVMDLVRLILNSRTFPYPEKEEDIQFIFRSNGINPTEDQMIQLMKESKEN